MVLPMASPSAHLVLLMIISIGHSHGKAERVDLSLYYESLCPYCRNFITNQLPYLFHSDLLSFVNLRLVPWGNAQFLQLNNTILCQHGEDECYLNTIHACAINIWPDPKKHFSFVECVESEGHQIHEEQNQHSAGADAAWKACSQTLGFNQMLIRDCYASGYGRKLSLRYAAETNHLNPPHRYVPWVTVNGQPLYDDYENFVAYICHAYKGKPPKACTSKSPHEAYKKETPRNNLQFQQALKGCRA